MRSASLKLGFWRCNVRKKVDWDKEKGAFENREARRSGEGTATTLENFGVALLLLKDDLSTFGFASFAVNIIRNDSNMR